MKNLIDIAGKVSSIKKILLIFIFVLISGLTLQAETPKIIIPEGLKPGDTIGLIAPARGHLLMQKWNIFLAEDLTLYMVVPMIQDGMDLEGLII